MNYSVSWSERSKNDLSAVEKGIRVRIIERVEKIKEKPFNYTKRLVGLPLYSLRIGDYRVIMDIRGKEMLIFVIQIGHRSKIYREV